jgi:hypothetical protein
MADIRYDRFLWTFSMALAMLLFFADPASAQDRSDDVYGDDRVSQSQDGSSVGLPSWAEPSSTTGDGAGGLQPPDASPNDTPPPPPIEQVPVDGGLALLAAAGAGYAVRRLRKSESGETDEPVA